jgi:anaerobic ribonucleoside-triphosphate reductase activating protein
MYYAQIRRSDTANGPGVRVSLFVSGCTHNCKGCFNKEQQSFTYGNIFTQEEENKIIELVKREGIRGINILGGEPMQQIMDSTLVNLLKRIKSETNKSIWLWSGYLYEDIIADKKRLEILKYVDVLVDGQFKEQLKDIRLKHRGSSNQRIIDVQQSLKNNVIIEKEELY